MLTWACLNASCIKWISSDTDSLVENVDDKDVTKFGKTCRFRRNAKLTNGNTLAMIIAIKNNRNHDFEIILSVLISGKPIKTTIVHAMSRIQDSQHLVGNIMSKLIYWTNVWNGGFIICYFLIKNSIYKWDYVYLLCSLYNENIFRSNSIFLLDVKMSQWRNG